MSGVNKLGRVRQAPEHATWVNRIPWAPEAVGVRLAGSGGAVRMGGVGRADPAGRLKRLACGWPGRVGRSEWVAEVGRILGAPEASGVRLAGSGGAGSSGWRGPAGFCGRPKHLACSWPGRMGRSGARGGARRILGRPKRLARAGSPVEAVWEWTR
ncbi:hypothetical protein Aab01nite_15440 [Paractinoplanes abujensis]|nr:hypothetical protein Aab01nite_15440 [Actinoplanes abujensis]